MTPPWSRVAVKPMGASRSTMSCVSMSAPRSANAMRPDSDRALLRGQLATSVDRARVDDQVRTRLAQELDEAGHGSVDPYGSRPVQRIDASERRPRRCGRSR